MFTVLQMRVSVFYVSVESVRSTWPSGPGVNYVCLLGEKQPSLRTPVRDDGRRNTSKEELEVSVQKHGCG